MLQIFQRLFQKPVSFVQGVLNPPEHIRLVGSGNSIEDCLRDLEKKARLPIGDLYVKGEPMKVVSFPVPRVGLNHFIGSRTSDAWAVDDSKQGYISGSIFEATSPYKPTDEQRSRLDIMGAVAVALANAVQFLGRLHISKNCPGVYCDNVCTTCGDVAP
jgi:hypothetical protein